MILSRTKLISENNIKDNGSLTSSSALPLSSDSSISYNQSEPAHQNEQVDQFKGPEPIPFVVSKIPNFETVIENDSSSEKDEIIQAKRVSVSSEEVISRKITIIEPEPEPKVSFFALFKAQQRNSNIPRRNHCKCPNTFPKMFDHPIFRKKNPRQFGFAGSVIIPILKTIRNLLFLREVTTK